MSRRPPVPHIVHDPSAAAVTSAARDAAWVEATRTGDDAAFEAIFREYAPRVCGYIYTLLGSRDRAEEIMQDLFLRIWEIRHTWTIQVPLKTYLFQAARNRATDYLRHDRVDREFRERVAVNTVIGPAAGPPTPAEEVDARELERSLEIAIDALPERCREVFLMNRRQHLSYADIARILGLSVKTVEIHMGRAFTALRRSLGDSGADSR